MELHQLRYFTAVAELGNFTRAAERCFVSQPSLSQQIIKLEQELGQPLLERLGRSVKLTDAGRAFYERAVQALATVEEARSSVQCAGDWQAGKISIGAILTVAPYLLPDVVRRFLKQFPRARVSVRESFTEQIVKETLAGDLDLGVVALPIDDAMLHVEPLMTEELLLAVPYQHALAKRRRVALADLSEHSFVLLDEIHCLGQQIVSFCQQNECRPAVSCKTAQLLTVQEMVGLGQGLSLVPAMAARADRSKTRVYRSLAGAAPTRTIAVIRRRARRQTQLGEAFEQCLRQFAGDAPATLTAN
jgi:LysR family hydrogen peroxide-inducible transcriptional activator